ncbi:MAG: TetR/AcrR family transcriptional regulator [Pseudomonadota bacterium]
MSKKQRQARRPDLRAELLEAAEKRVKEGGVSSLSLRNLAADVGVTTMATYHHFANKEALLVQIAINGYEELTAMMVADLSDDASPNENVKSIMRGYFKYALNNLSVYHLMFGQEIQGKQTIPEFKEAASKNFYIWASALAKHLEDMDHEVDVDDVGIAFWALLHGLVCLVSDGTILFKAGNDKTKINKLIDRAERGLYYLR